MPSFFHRGFSGGVISRLLWARQDTTKVSPGAATLANMVVLKNGSVANRTGLEYVGTVKTSADATRVFPWIFSDGQAYLLEAGDEYVRIWDDGDALLVTAAAAYSALTEYEPGDLAASVANTPTYYVCIAPNGPATATQALTEADYWYPLTTVTAGLGGTAIYELPSVFDKTELFEVGYSQSADVMNLTHRSHPPQQLTRNGATDWTMLATLFKPSISGPTGISATSEGAGSSVDLRWQVTAIKEDGTEESLPGYAASPVTGYFFGTGGSPAAYNGGTTYQLGDRATSAGTTYVAILSGGFSGVAPPNATNWYAISTSGNDILVIATAHGLVDGDQTALFNVVGVSAFKAAVQDKTFVVNQLNVNAFTLNDTDGSVYTSHAYFSVGIPFVELTSVGPPTATTNNHEIAWTAVSGAQEYWIYRSQTNAGDDPNNVFGYVGNSKTTSWSDSTPTPDFTATPPIHRNPFDESGKYPAVSTYYQQRFILAGTTDEPTGVWMSRIGSFDNFADRSPLQDDDSIALTVPGGGPGIVRGLTPIEQLALFVSSGEWIVQGDESGTIKPGSPNLRQQSYEGSSTVRPMVVAGSPLWVGPFGNVVFASEFTDGGRLTPRDLTVLAPELFAGHTIVDWAYAQHPDSTVYAIREDGKWLCLTFVPDQDIWAWSGPHETDGTVESVAVIPEGGRSVPYFVVKRNINASDVRYIERLVERKTDRDDFNITTDAFYVDCGATYSGAPATNITGATHLNGETVAVLADGVAYTRVIAAGAFTVALPTGASVIHVGLPYNASLETLDPDAPQADKNNPLIDRARDLTGISLLLQNSRGWSYGPDSSTLETYKPGGTASATAAISGTRYMTPKNKSRVNGGVYIRQTQPLPLVILGLVESFDVGERGVRAS